MSVILHRRFTPIAVVRLPHPLHPHHADALQVDVQLVDVQPADASWAAALAAVDSVHFATLVASANLAIHGHCSVADAMSPD